MDDAAIAAKLVGALVQFEILESVYFLRHLIYRAGAGIVADLTICEGDSQTLQKTFRRFSIVRLLVVRIPPPKPDFYNRWS